MTPETGVLYGFPKVRFFHILEPSICFSSVQLSIYPVTFASSLERVAVEQKPIKNICIVGGGTAGFLTALSFQKERSEINIQLIESKNIPVIGVGEATTRIIVPFLHQELGFEIGEFYKAVKPTWKQGIRFEWGEPDTWFNYPFGFNDSYASYYEDGNLQRGSLQSVLMKANKSFIIRNEKKTQALKSIVKKHNYAYHLDNVSFINFLRSKALAAGIQIINRDVIDIHCHTDNGWVNRLQLDDGSSLSADLYVDCTGFRSLLLEQQMKSPFVSYAKSLFTDRALVSKQSNGGVIKPYTTATTMNSGWLWNIPLRAEDHLGYVYSSAFCSDEEAEREMKQLQPGLSTLKKVQFRSGRHEHCWKGNVLAIGNSYGFVEPLESTGIQMIIAEIKTTLEMFPRHVHDEKAKSAINKHLNKRWDHLKWFLAWHFKYNKKKDTDFWKACRSDVDVSGYDVLFDHFVENGPFRKPVNLGNEALRAELNGSLFRFNGLDNMLIGQGVLPNAVDHTYLEEKRRELRKQTQLWHQLSALALPQLEALREVELHPELLTN